MRLATLKREIIRDFGTERELNKYQKEILSAIVQSLSFDYDIGEKFHEYIEKNQPDHKHGLKYVPLSVLNSLKNKDFLDCGAYFGDSALMFARDYHPNNIYSFEPDPENYRILLETIKYHNFKNVVPISKCVGEKCGEADFYTMGPFSHIPEAEGNSVMEMTTVDEFVRERKLDVGVIKIDIEGYEMEVLEGAKKTIVDQKPVLLLGIYHNPKEFFEAKQFVQELTPKYNFIFKILSDVRPIAESYIIAW